MTVLRQAANILDISEFDVLHHAYEHWYGKAAPVEVINRAFSHYLTNHEVPHWGRHYALDVIASFETEIAAKCACLGLLWQLAWGPKTTSNNESSMMMA